MFSLERKVSISEVMYSVLKALPDSRLLTFLTSLLLNYPLTMSSRLTSLQTPVILWQYVSLPGQLSLNDSTQYRRIFSGITYHSIGVVLLCYIYSMYVLVVVLCITVLVLLY